MNPWPSAYSTTLASLEASAYPNVSGIIFNQASDQVKVMIGIGRYEAKLRRILHAHLSVEAFVQSFHYARGGDAAMLLHA